MLTFKIFFTNVEDSCTKIFYVSNHKYFSFKPVYKKKFRDTGCKHRKNLVFYTWLAFSVKFKIEFLK